MNDQRPVVSRSVYLRRKRRRRLLKIRRACFILTFLLIVVGIVVGIVEIGERIRVKNQLSAAQNIEVPDYVDVQLLEVGKARTGVKLSSVKNIVIHYVGNPGTSAQNNRDYFAKSDTEVCSHFLVGLNGEIIQCVPLNEKSAASNWRNIDTISIEICHPDETGKFNEETYASAVKLTAWLCKTFGLSQRDVIRHYDITEKLCPLYYVEHPDAWSDFQDAVRDALKELKKES